jgi:hypothetical protein
MEIDARETSTQEMESFGGLTDIINLLTTKYANLFGGVVSQLAPASSAYSNSSSSVNISVPVNATIRNDADIRVLAYAISQEIAANVRA